MVRTAWGCLQSLSVDRGGLMAACATLLHFMQTHEGDMRLVSVYIPTNHVYVGECAVVVGSGWRRGP